MRVFYAVVMAAVLATPVYAQGHNKTPGPAPGPAAKTQQQIDAERAADRAYQNSLKNIPDQPAADPWGNARGLDSAKTAANKTTAKAKPTPKQP